MSVSDTFELSRSSFKDQALDTDHTETTFKTQETSAYETPDLLKAKPKKKIKGDLSKFLLEGRIESPQKVKPSNYLNKHPGDETTF